MTKNMIAGTACEEQFMSFVIMRPSTNVNGDFPLRVLHRSAGVGYWVAAGRQDYPATEFSKEAADAIVFAMHVGQPNHRSEVVEELP